MWSEETWMIGEWEVLIAASVRGEPCAPMVYLVRDKDRFLYIGQTRVGLVRRLRQHVKSKTSRLGHFAQQWGQDKSGWRVLFTVVNGDLDAAERHYVRSLTPIFNGQRFMQPEEDGLNE